VAPHSTTAAANHAASELSPEVSSQYMWMVPHYNTAEWEMPMHVPASQEECSKSVHEVYRFDDRARIILPASHPLVKNEMARNTLGLGSWQSNVVIADDTFDSITMPSHQPSSNNNVDPASSLNVAMVPNNDIEWLILPSWDPLKNE